MMLHCRRDEEEADPGKKVGKREQSLKTVGLLLPKVTQQLRAALVDREAYATTNASNELSTTALRLLLLHPAG